MFKKICTFIPLLAILVLLDPMLAKIFGFVSWFFFVAVMFIRPAVSVFGPQKPLLALLAVRKELGIAAAVFGLAHGLPLLFFKWGMVANMSFSLTSGMLWGLVSGLLCIPLLITSNRFSQKTLGKYWKPLQKLAYLAYIGGLLHIVFLAPAFAFLALVSLFVWVTLWLLAAYGHTFSKSKNIVVIALVISLVCSALASTLVSNNRPARGHRPETTHSGATATHDTKSLDAQSPTDSDTDDRNGKGEDTTNDTDTN